MLISAKQSLTARKVLNITSEKEYLFHKRIIHETFLDEPFDENFYDRIINNQTLFYHREYMYEIQVPVGKKFDTRSVMIHFTAAGVIENKSRRLHKLEGMMHNLTDDESVTMTTYHAYELLEYLGKEESEEFSMDISTTWDIIEECREKKAAKVEKEGGDVA